MAFVAVVKMLSSSSAGRSSGASDATVNADCVDSLDALDVLSRLDFAFLGAGLFRCSLTRAKKGHSGERLKCSSLPKLTSANCGKRDQGAYIGLSEFSHPSRARLQYAQVAISSYSGVGVYFHPASTI